MVKIESTDELETNLIGVTVVVLAVNFMGAVFAGKTDNLLQYGAGIALPISALGVFVGLRAWSNKLSKGAGVPKGNRSNEEDEWVRTRDADMGLSIGLFSWMCCSTSKRARF